MSGELASWSDGKASCRILEDGTVERSTLSLGHAYRLIEFLAEGWAEAFDDAMDVRWERDAEHELVLVPNAPLPEEDKAAAELEGAGIGISRIGEGERTNPLCQQWGVFHGSHGGYGRRLRQAMFRSLVCCKIGGWWKTETGELMRDLFDRIAAEHLGGPFLWPKWVEEPKE